MILHRVLQDPDVFSKYPEPDDAAKIMVVYRFRPQIQALLCNYAAAAKRT